jgi:two-component system sensor histidine kinase KdpD
VTSPRGRAGWIIWPLVMIAATALLVIFRTGIEQSHAALILLLIVLGGSTAGGRALGFSLAGLGFALLDYFFQPPYDQIAVSKPLDWIVLIAFIATAFVTTELLARAQQEKVLAEARASEVSTLAEMGAETLRHAEPENALEAITRLVREAIGAAACTVIPWDGDDAGAAEVLSGGGMNAVERIAAREAISTGMMAVADVGGTVHTEDIATLDSADPAALRGHVLAIPLRAEKRVIGVLLVRGDPSLVVDAPRRRLLAALGYYATLGVERIRLKQEAKRSEALESAQRAKDEIFAAVSHDLRTPITTIGVLAQGAALRGVPEAAAIIEQSDRLAHMVADLLEISRLRTGSYSLNAELNTAEDLVGAAVRLMRGSLDGRQVDVHIDLDAPALVGRFDFVHTLRILCNLLDNALRHSPPAAAVELRATREGRWLTFSVADSGTGVPVEERGRIFEAFYRPSDATPDGGHAGLGLSIARGLAELQGGSVEYQPRQGGGSVFRLQLPAAEVHEITVENG